MRRARITRVDAEDVVVDAMLRLIVSRPVARNAEALLTTSALNLLYTAKRREASLPKRLTITPDLGDSSEAAVAEGPVDHSADPVPQLGDEEERALRSAALRSALGSLSETDRSLLTSYYFDGRSLCAIDSERGDPPGTAKVRIHRARGRLRDLVGTAEEKRGWSR